MLFLDKVKHACIQNISYISIIMLVVYTLFIPIQNTIYFQLKLNGDDAKSATNDKAKKGNTFCKLLWLCILALDI